MATKISQTQTLQKLRSGIDAIDKKLVILLARRFALTKKVGIYKAAHRLPARDAAREREVFKERRAWATMHNVDAGLVHQLFVSILKTVRHKHTALKKTKSTKAV